MNIYTNEEEFKNIAKEVKKKIKKQLEKYNIELVKFNINHFYISGFLKKEQKYLYFSTYDYRYFRDKFYNEILIRKCKDENDYKGETNSYCSIENFGEKINCLI